MAKVFALFFATFVFSAALAAPIEGDDEKQIDEIAKEITSVMDHVMKTFQDSTPTNEEIKKFVEKFKTGVNDIANDLGTKLGVKEEDLQKLREHREKFETIITTHAQATVDELKPIAEEAIKKMRADLAEVHAKVNPTVEKAGQDMKDAAVKIYKQWLHNANEFWEKVQEKVESDSHK